MNVTAAVSRGVGGLSLATIWISNGIFWKDTCKLHLLKRLVSACFYTHSNSPRAAFLDKLDNAFNRCKQHLALDNSRSPLSPFALQDLHSSWSRITLLHAEGSGGEDKDKPALWKINSSTKAPQDTTRHILRKLPFLQHTTEHNSYQEPFLQHSHTLPWSLATLPQPLTPNPAPQKCLSTAAGNHCKGCSTPPLQMKRNPSEMLLWAL